MTYSRQTIIGVLVVLVVLGGVVMVMRLKSSATRSGVLSALSNATEPPLLLKSIGIRLEEYNAKTNRAGDFRFTDANLQFGRVWMDYGFSIPASSASRAKDNPQPTFILPLGTKVRSLVDGVVVGIPKLYSGDYSIHVASDSQSRFRYETEHVIKPVVKVGDRVVAGQVMAEVSDYDSKGMPGFGIVEIGILKGGNPPQHLCPFAYLDPTIKGEVHKKILALYASWEKYRQNTKLYTESGYKVPGCLTLNLIDG